MAGKAFVDTNVLLRAIIPSLNQHVEAEALLQKMWEEEVELWISRQVIREYLVQATHPTNIVPPLSIDQIIHQMDRITALFRIDDETPAVTARLFYLLKTYPTRGKQVHDANLVATMIVYEIDTLLTLNIDDLKRFGDKIKLVSP
jgi:predicted nucleic acid-binding protein